MNDTELNNKLIDLLGQKAGESKNFPRHFGAKEVAEEVGGSFTRVGHVSEAVVTELIARGVSITYDKSSNPKKFIISGVDA